MGLQMTMTLTRILLIAAFVTTIGGCKEGAGSFTSNTADRSSSSSTSPSGGPFSSGGGERSQTQEGADTGQTVTQTGGSRPQELVGKWCYMANVNASDGGRQSNRCFTLYADGRYEYYAETSSSGEYGSSASQESDYGTWSATPDTITANSQTSGTQTFRLEKLNHPRTNDPMLVLDGEAYVTYGQKPPW